MEELDPEFLAELPEDVRREVVADHRRQRMAQRAGLDAPTRKLPAPEPNRRLSGGQRRIQFPTPPPKIVFSGFDVTNTQEIKDMLDAWLAETQEEGPHAGDVTVFENYLARVVAEEKDMPKAAQLVKWLDLVVNHDGAPGPGGRAWRRSLAGVKAAVQQAIKERGLAPLNM
jgi:DNA repair protein REV1